VAVIVDTNALSAVADGDPSVEAPFRQAPSVAIPVIVLGEYLFGVMQSRRKGDYEKWLSVNLKFVTILNIDLQTARRYSELRLELKTAGKPIPINDLWIAALCRQHALPLLSRDRHFDLIRGLQRISW
jgi:tRNA(fMet)-specific endonuclease VapC